MTERAAIIGASSNRAKFGNKAVRAYSEAGYEVYPVNPNEEVIEGLKVYPAVEDIPDELDVISIYLPPEIGMKVIDQVAKKGAKAIYLNPGAVSDELVMKAKNIGLNPITACSIRTIGKDPADFD